MGNIILDSIPKDTQIDIKILVNDPVAHTNNHGPGDVRVGNSCWLADQARCFSNDLNFTYDSTLYEGAYLKVSPTHVACELLKLACGNKHIQ